MDKSLEEFCREGAAMWQVTGLQTPKSKGFTRWTGVSIMKHPGTQSNEFWG